MIVAPTNKNLIRNSHETKTIKIKKVCFFILADNNNDNKKTSKNSENDKNNKIDNDDKNNEDDDDNDDNNDDLHFKDGDDL